MAKLSFNCTGNLEIELRTGSIVHIDKNQIKFIPMDFDKAINELNKFPDKTFTVNSNEWQGGEIVCWTECTKFCQIII